jgi:hypothetical protein
LPNYENLKDELSKILENQRISKKKQDQILETTQRGFIGIALRNEELRKSNEQLNLINFYDKHKKISLNYSSRSPFSSKKISSVSFRN